MPDLADALAALALPAPPGLTDRVLARVGAVDAAAVVDSPAGPLLVGWTGTGVSVVVPAGPDAAEQAAARLGRPVAVVAKAPAAVAAAVRSGRGRQLRYDLRTRTPFERAVLQAALAIPAGEVRTYSWLAAEIGRPAAVRAVGSALGRNPVPVLIPCHRVVRTDGRIGDYAFGTPMKRTLLSAEGVDLDRLERLAAAGVRYVGSDTTRVFCLPTCRHARRISEPHRVAFRDLAAAGRAGYRPCRDCRPVSTAQSPA